MRFLVFRVVYHGNRSTPACPTIPTLIPLRAGRAVETVSRPYRAGHGTIDRKGRSERLTDHRDRNSDRQVFRESFRMDGKIFLDHFTLASREPETDSRKHFRNLDDRGKMFHRLQVSGIMPAENAIGTRLASKLPVEERNHCSHPSVHIFLKNFQASILSRLDRRKNIHTLESVARKAYAPFFLAKDFPEDAFPCGETIRETGHFRRFRETADPFPERSYRFHSARLYPVHRWNARAFSRNCASHGTA